MCFHRSCKLCEALRVGFKKYLDLKQATNMYVYLVILKYSYSDLNKDSNGVRLGAGIYSTYDSSKYIW
jgi:hypothetical protein